MKCNRTYTRLCNYVTPDVIDVGLPCETTILRRLTKKAHLCPMHSYRVDSCTQNDYLPAHMFIFIICPGRFIKPLLKKSLREKTVQVSESI